VNPDVTSLLARGLTDRRFCRALLAQDNAPIDAQRLALFAGFITKVRHSDLFEYAPGTLAVLRAHRAEIGFFRDYFLDRDPRPRGDTAAKVAAVFGYVGEFAARASIRGLRDVAAHERCLYEIRTDLVAPHDPGVFTGPVRWLRLHHDPHEVIAAAMRGEGSATRARPRWWLYVGSRGDAELRTIEIDRDVAATLAFLQTGISRPRLARRRRDAITNHLVIAGVVRPMELR
jgi:hypothetical protein